MRGDSIKTNCLAERKLQYLRNLQNFSEFTSPKGECGCSELRVCRSVCVLDLVHIELKLHFDASMCSNYPNDSQSLTSREATERECCLKTIFGRLFCVLNINYICFCFPIKHMSKSNSYDPENG